MANLDDPAAIAPERKPETRKTRSSSSRSSRRTVADVETRSAANRDNGQPPRALIHTDHPTAAAVERVLKAAARIGLDATCTPAVNGKRVGTLGPEFDLIIVHLMEGMPVPLTLARLRHAHPGSKLVVLGDDGVPSSFDGLFAEGTRGFIPSRYSEEAMAAALQLIRAGECFGPQIAARDDGTARKPAFSDVGMRDFGLTKVEREVLSLAAQGLTNLEISLRRGGVEGTVKVHMNHIFNKLNVRSRCEAIAVYLQTHNVDPEELRRAQSGDMDMKWLLSTMTHEHHLKGTVLFRRGQQGDRIYYLQNGIVRLKEIEVDMHPRDLFGEIGVFAPEHKRTCTAVCSTDVDLFSLSFDEVRRCYFLNPQFAFYVMYLITQRLMADRERFQDSIG